MIMDGGNRDKVDMEDNLYENIISYLKEEGDEKKTNAVNDGEHQQMIIDDKLSTKRMNSANLSRIGKADKRSVVTASGKRSIDLTLIKLN